MSTGVAIAAHNGHAGLGQALLGPDDVHNPLIFGAEGKQWNAKITAVRFELGQLCLCLCILHGDDSIGPTWRGRRGMIHGGNGLVGATYLQPALA